MATFNKDKLALVHQFVAKGPRTFHYTDTGLLIADVNEVEGFFSTGYDAGMRHGDRVLITEGDTGTYDTGGHQTGGRRQYIATVLKAQDTGATQVTLGLAVLVGDTS
jgi:hypothetical protein